MNRHGSTLALVAEVTKEDTLSLVQMRQVATYRSVSTLARTLWLVV